MATTIASATTRPGAAMIRTETTTPTTTMARAVIRTTTRRTTTKAMMGSRTRMRPATSETATTRTRISATTIPEGDGDSFSPERGAMARSPFRLRPDFCRSRPKRPFEHSISAGGCAAFADRPRSSRSGRVGSRSPSASAHGGQEGDLVPFPQDALGPDDLVVHREEHVVPVTDEPRVLREDRLHELAHRRSVPQRPCELPRADDLAVRGEEPHLHLHDPDSDGLGRR